MFITADQILAHLIGDYLLQSHWMATEKTKQTLAAVVHVLCYSLPFILLAPTWGALNFIFITHFIIDRWRLARFVVWAKNGCIWPVTPTGYPADVPPWLSVWLLIIADNTLHLICNGFAIKYL